MKSKNSDRNSKSHGDKLKKERHQGQTSQKGRKLAGKKKGCVRKKKTKAKVMLLGRTWGDSPPLKKKRKNF